MSWKGFQKAMARLPQMVKQKTGFADETADEEFKELNLTYVRIKQDTNKFLSECVSYKAAMLTLLNFQVSLIEEHQWQIDEKGFSFDEYIESLQTLKSTLSTQLEESVDRLLIKPLTEYQLLLIKVESIIKKRNNKLLDYDRNRIAFQKISESTRRSELSEEKKIVKQEQAFNQATMEYERYNNLLKFELPRLLELRSGLLKPGVEALILFQQVFYSKSSAIFSASALVKGIDKSKSSQEKYEKYIEPIMGEFRAMGMFHGAGLKYSSNASDEYEAEITPVQAHAQMQMPPEYESLKEKKDASDEKSGTMATTNSRPPVPAAPRFKSQKQTLVKAIYDFNGQDPDDLSFKMGDLIEVLDSSDQYGWWTGRINGGKKGNFPSNYVIDQESK